MLHQKADKGEIKPTPMQPSNAASFGAYDTKQCRQAIADWQAHAVIPPRKNAKPWKDTKSSSLERNELLRTVKRLGGTLWKKWSGYIIDEVWLKLKCTALNC